MYIYLYIQGMGFEVVRGPRACARAGRSQNPGRALVHHAAGGISSTEIATLDLKSTK